MPLPAFVFALTGGEGGPRRKGEWLCVSLAPLPSWTEVSWVPQGTAAPPGALGRTEPPGAIIQELTPVSAGPPWTGGWGSTSGGSRRPSKSGLWASGDGRGEQDLSSHMSLGLSCALLQGLPGDPGPRGPVGPPGLKGEKVRGQWGWSTL